ncbi:MAG TPA: GFA family protein [Alphaproteobacteria bacterium]|nr:GFA family protein [Alphaproteobacteria bacterium]
MTDRAREHEGGCLCGDIRYRTGVEPVRITICHCRFCQRATGSAYFVEPIFGREDFRIVAGAPKVYLHRSEGSGKTVFVNFCGSCGTKLFLGFERFPDVVGVYAGTFDDPVWFEQLADNSKHIFLESARRGTIIPPGIDTYRRHATEIDGTPIEPEIFKEPHVI